MCYLSLNTRGAVTCRLPVCELSHVHTPRVQEWYRCIHACPPSYVCHALLLLKYPIFSYLPHHNTSRNPSATSLLEVSSQWWNIAKHPHRSGQHGSSVGRQIHPKSRKQPHYDPLNKAKLYPLWDPYWEEHSTAPAFNFPAAKSIFFDYPGSGFRDATHPRKPVVEPTKKDDDEEVRPLVRHDRG